MRLTQILNEQTILESIQFNVEQGIDIIDCQFRPGSKMFEQYFMYLKENSEQYELDEIDQMMIDNGLGQTAEYEGETVSLGIPFVELNEAEDVELNVPKRGGSKKYYVYVKDPKTGKIKKVSFGAKDGGADLKVKFADPERRKAFNDRHKCSEKTDITTPGYWSCALPKYADKLGLKGGGNFFW